MAPFIIYAIPAEIYLFIDIVVGDLYHVELGTTVCWMN